MNILKSIELFLEHCEFERNLSENTILFYKTDLLQFADFLMKESVDSPKELNKDVIKSYVQELSKFEPRTVKRKIASSKTYLNFLEFEDYIAVNPFRKVRIRIKNAQQLPTVLTFDEIKRLLQVLHVEKDKNENRNSFKYGEKLRDLTVFELLFVTGMRVSELCGLQPSDINLVDGRILVRGKGRKERMVQVCNKETLKTLRDYHQLYERRMEKTGFFLSVA